DVPQRSSCLPRTPDVSSLAKDSVKTITSSANLFVLSARSPFAGFIRWMFSRLRVLHFPRSALRVPRSKGIFAPAFFRRVLRRPFRRFCHRESQSFVESRRRFPGRASRARSYGLCGSDREK